MIARLIGIGAAVLGALVGIAPFLDWYLADLPERRIAFAGIDVAGELWTLPVLSIPIVGLGVAIAVARPDPRATLARWAGGALTLLGAFALAWALKSALDVGAVALPAGVPDGPGAPLRAQPVAFICAAAAAAVACAGLAWLREGSA